MTGPARASPGARPRGDIDHEGGFTTTHWAMERMASPDRDPFSNTADPASYVPRTATEAVLVQLEMALRDGAPVVSLGGPDGAGKTLLLRVLVERLAGDFQPVLVPYPKLPPEEFCQWGLLALNEPSSADPERALSARIARGAASAGLSLLWLVDDAACLPIDTLRCLLRLQANAGDALRLLFVRPEGAAFDDELARAGLPRVDVQLEGEMHPAEMAMYVKERLDRAGADSEQRARLEGSLERLYALSGGNPGRLHAAASALLCFDSPEIALDAIAGESASSGVEESEPSAAPDTELSQAAEPAAESAAAHSAEPTPAAETAAVPDRSPKRRRLRRLGRR